jgi:hypothetical protein
MLVSKTRKEEDDNNNTEEPLTDASAQPEAPRPWRPQGTSRSRGQLKVKRDRGYPRDCPRRPEGEDQEGTRGTSLRSDHDGPERPLTMARNGCS